MNLMKRACWNRHLAKLEEFVERKKLVATTLLAAILAMTSVQTAIAESPPVHIVSWGTLGKEKGQFKNPQAVAVDVAGNVYVTDHDNDRVEKFGPNGDFITEWGADGEFPGQFQWPAGIATDSQSNVYVVDGGNDRIQKFDSGGKFLATWGTFGTGNGQFISPKGITVDAANNIFVADYGNSRIQMFSASGKFLGKWGSEGGGDGQFEFPAAIDSDGSGNVYVADSSNSRIQMFTGTGTFLAKWGSLGKGEGQLDHPFGIAVEPSGNILVADSKNFRMQKFGPSGTFLSTWGAFGMGEGQFIVPSGVDTNASGAIYVVDTENDRVQKFAYPPESPGALTTNPSSPSSSTSIKVKGSSKLGGSIKLYDTPDCSGTPIAEGPSSAFTSDGITVKVAEGSTTKLYATVTDLDNLTSKCSLDSVTYVHEAHAIATDPCVAFLPAALCTPTFPELAEPTRTAATFDGRYLYVRLKCPARFKPACSSKANPTTLKTSKGQAMSRATSKVTKSNHWRKFTFTIKPHYRTKVLKMSTVDRKLLFVKQVIRSRKVNRRVDQAPSVVFHTYKVRIQG